MDVISLLAIGARCMSPSRMARPPPCDGMRLTHTPASVKSMAKRIAGFGHFGRGWQRRDSEIPNSTDGKGEVDKSSEQGTSQSLGRFPEKLT